MSGIFDYSGIHIQFAPGYFADCQAKLESLVEPHVVDDGAYPIIRFRGDKRNIKPGCHVTIVFALQSLYRLLDAIEAGDIPTIVNAAIAFGQFKSELDEKEIFGVDRLKALSRAASARERGKETIQVINADHVELHDQYQPELDRLMQYGDPGGLSYRKAVAELQRLFGVSARTIEQHTTN